MYRHLVLLSCILLVGALVLDASLFAGNAFTSNMISKATRFNIPFLGIGVQCNGCPPQSCEDDEAIIHGYCCGCAMFSDYLPVLCPGFLQCPLNLHGLCHDYEYMMRCCC